MPSIKRWRSGLTCACKKVMIGLLVENQAYCLTRRRTEPRAGRPSMSGQFSFVETDIVKAQIFKAVFLVRSDYNAIETPLLTFQRIRFKVLSSQQFEAASTSGLASSIKDNVA
ncbi:hypothetical protein [Caballeronia sp. 15711]|uniref:hypothetical protein n=1 Tax=Caballeronia sp. 15711 TaxID=3391029 RepID=UPI0039E51DA9